MQNMPEEERERVFIQNIESLPNAVFKVTVSNGESTTHMVRFSQEYYNKLTNAEISPEDLVRRSFEFLLERESHKTILGEFGLDEIGKYFPEYEEQIKK